MSNQTTRQDGLTGPERNRLLGILGMLGSDFDGERAAAALLATKLLRAKRLQWEDLIGAALPDPDATGSDADNLAFCRAHLAHLDPWPQEFVRSLGLRRKPLTLGQSAKLAELARDLRAGGLA